MDVKSEIAGKVWKIVATVGDTVAEDDEILILESMKMEIPVLAEHAGLVEEIFVEVGTVVQEGDALVSLR